MGFIEREAEVVGVIEIGGNQDVELAVAQNLKRADIGIPQTRWDLHGVSLEGAKELSMQRNGWLSQILDERTGFVDLGAGNDGYEKYQVFFGDRIGDLFTFCGIII